MTDLTGLAIVRELIARPTMEPYNALTGTRFVSVELGSATAEIAPEHGVTDRHGRLLPGIAAAVADAALGSTVMSALPSGSGTVTASLGVEYVPMLAPARSLRCVGHALYAGELTGFAHGAVVDDRGRVRAHASIRSAIRAAPGVPQADPDSPPMQLPAHATVPTAGVFSEQLAPPDLDALLDSQVAEWCRLSISTHDDSLRGEVTTTPELANFWGILHGGAGAMFSELAALALVHQLDGVRTVSPQSVSFSFLRPVGLDGAVPVEADVIQRGRTLVRTEGRLLAADGRPAVITSATTGITTG